MTTTAKIKLTAQDNTGRAFKSLNRNIRSANKTMGSLKSALVGIAGAAGLGKLISSGLDAADRIDKLAKATGFSVEALSELKHAAELSGVSFEGMTTGMKKMQKTLDDADRGLSTAKDALEAVGLTVEELKGLEPDRQFEIMAGAISTMTDPTEKVATAMNIFGRAGADLIPMLNEGEEGIRAMREEAVALGGAMTKDQAAAAAATKDAMTKLSTAFSGVVNKLVVELGPALTEAFTWLGENLPAAIEKLKKAIVVVVAVIDGMRATWQTMVSIGQVAIDALVDAWNTMKARVLKIMIGLLELIKQAMDTLAWVMPEGATKAVDGVLEELERMKDEAVGHSIVPEMVESIGDVMDTLPEKMITPATTAADGVLDTFETMKTDTNDLFEKMNKSVVDSFKDLFGDTLRGDIKSFAEFTKKAFDIIKDAVIDLLAQMIALAALKWLFAILGFPVPAFATGGKFTVGSNGMGPATAPGFASGGSFMVGGQGNADSQLVNFRATPGERVTVETPDQQRASNRRDQAGVIAELKMLRHDLANVITRPIVGQLARGQMAMAGGARH